MFGIVGRLVSGLVQCFWSQGTSRNPIRTVLPHHGAKIISGVAHVWRFENGSLLFFADTYRTRYMIIIEHDAVIGTVYYVEDRGDHTHNASRRMTPFDLKELTRLMERNLPQCPGNQERDLFHEFKSEFYKAVVT